MDYLDFTGSNSFKDKTSIEKGTTNNTDAVIKGSENINKMNNSPNNKKCECSPLIKLFSGKASYRIFL